MEKPIEAKVSNRRVSPRRKARSFVKLECRKGTLGLGANLVYSLLDVSETGVRLIVRQELQPLQEVEITLAGHGMGKVLKRLASVRWQVKLEDGNFCIGAQFQKRLEYSDWQTLAAPS